MRQFKEKSPQKFKNDFKWPNFRAERPKRLVNMKV